MHRALPHIRVMQLTTDAVAVIGRVALGGALVLAALGLWAAQAIWFFQSGDWTSLSMVDAIGWLGSPWAEAPGEWQGLHVALGYVPIPLLMLIAGALIFPRD